MYNFITRKLYGHTFKKVHRNKNHYKVPMSNIFFLRKGESANVHSGHLTVCSFAVLKILHKDTNEHIGNLFWHQGIDRVDFTMDPKWKAEVIFIRHAPDTVFEDGHNHGDTLHMLIDGFHGHHVTGNPNAVKKKGKGGLFIATGTFEVNEEGTVEEAEPNTSVYTENSGSGGGCTIL